MNETDRKFIILCLDKFILFNFVKHSNVYRINI